MASELQIEPIEASPTPMHNLTSTKPEAVESELEAPLPPPETIASMDELLMNLPVELQMLIFRAAGAWAVSGQSMVQSGTLASWSVCRKWRFLIWNTEGFLTLLAQIIVDFEETRRTDRGKSAVDLALLRLSKAGKFSQWFFPRDH